MINISINDGDTTLSLKDVSKMEIDTKGNICIEFNKSDDSIESESSHKKFILSEKSQFRKKEFDDLDVNNIFSMAETPEYMEANEEPKKDPTSYQQDILREGAMSLRSLVEGWSVGYRQDVEQPDRQKLLRDTFEFDIGKILKYIHQCGGLTKAILECTELERKLGRDIAMNICQVSSILFPPLAETCELSFKI